MDNKFNLNRIFHLKNVYHLLQNENVPFVDRLLATFDTTAVLSPRGINRPPEDEQELLYAVICVLEALRVGRLVSIITTGC